VGDHAILIGASIAGLLVARVLLQRPGPPAMKPSKPSRSRTRFCRTRAITVSASHHRTTPAPGVHETSPEAIDGHQRSRQPGRH
jgi:hypothetical protein